MNFNKSEFNDRSLININSPTNIGEIKKLKVGDKISISGVIYTARDAVIPKLVESVKSNQKIAEKELSLEGHTIMHTAVSNAGISPTSSNKDAIEEYIPFLSKSGIRMHIGKGKLNEKTIKLLNKHNSIFIVTPPTAALLSSKIISSEVIAFKEEGIEAMHKLIVKDLPGIIAVANDKSIF